MLLQVLLMLQCPVTVYIVVQHVLLESLLVIIYLTVTLLGPQLSLHHTDL